MKRELLVLCMLCACGGSQAQTTTTAPSATTTVTVTAPEDAGAMTVVDAAATTSSPEPLPPAKPTTIRLADASGDAVDQELDAGDAAFEKNALGDAKQHYEAAKKLGPKRAGPIVGLLRV
ncbi:MAG TPA: hypothetical protein VH054_23480, partial [Polyangiaceae bacterium]|nr:hypothetical protein [Polyangiaceae bacterium]